MPNRQHSDDIVLQHEPLAEDAIANQQPEVINPVGGEQLIEGGGVKEECEAERKTTTEKYAFYPGNTICRFGFTDGIT